MTIRYNTAVDHIDWSNPTTVTLTLTQSGGSLTPSEFLTADAVIFTGSLGVLKERGEFLFSPPLPPEKMAAVSGLHIGVVDKVFLEFPLPEGGVKAGGPTHNGRVARVVGGNHVPGEDSRGNQEWPDEFASQPPPIAPPSNNHHNNGSSSSRDGSNKEPAVGPRRPKPATASATGGATAATAADGGSSDRATYLSYCLIWPTEQQHWTTEAAPAAAARAEGARVPAAAVGGRTDAGTDGAALGLDHLSLNSSIPASLYKDMRTVDPIYAGPVVRAPAAAPAAATAAAPPTAGAAPTTAAPAATGAGATPLGHSAAGAAAAQGEGLPLWLYGLHSWRYSDGPEWTKAPHSSRLFTSSSSSSSHAASKEAIAACIGSSSNLPWALLWQQSESQQGPQQAQREQRAQQPLWAGRSGYCAVLWVTGWAALQLEQLEDEQVLQHLEQLLLSYPAIPLPPNDHASNSSSSSVGSRNGLRVLEGCKVFRSNWGVNPYTRGSYSYPGVGEDERAAGGSAADMLAAPLVATQPARQTSTAAAAEQDMESRGGVPLVCFAGEATSRSHMGTVHGAFGSGVREAYRLLEAWGLS